MLKLMLEFIFLSPDEPDSGEDIIKVGKAGRIVETYAAQGSFLQRYHILEEMTFNMKKSVHI